MSQSTPKKILNPGPDSIERLTLAKTLNQSAFLWKLLKAVLTLLVFFRAIQLSYFDQLGKFKSITDFNAFYVAGKLALEGRLSEAYHADLMHSALINRTGAEGFMPWTYPLPFNLITSSLARLPIGSAYLLFMTFSVWSFMTISTKLLGKNVRLVTFLILPTFLVNIACGQNGLMTGSLVGLFCLWHLEQKAIAGIPAGLMIIKPHLVAGIALYVMLRRDWRTLLYAGTTALTCITLATGIYGISIWADFFSSVNESSNTLLEGRYLLFRMTSAFAAVFTLTHDEHWASLAQCSSIAIGLLLTAWIIKKTTAPRDSLGLICLISALYSPYYYDYDLSIFGIGLGLLLPTIQTRLTAPQQVIIAMAFILAQAGWFRLTVLEILLDTALTSSPDLLSLSFFLLLVVMSLSMKAINNSERLRSTAD